jgi:hypothetical protein
MSSTLVIVGSHLPGGHQVLFAHELVGPSQVTLEASEPLTTASLSAKLALTDVFTGRAIPLVVELTYSVIDGADEETDSLHVQGPDVSIDSIFHGIFRGATVTGSLILEGELFEPDRWLSRKVGCVDASDLTIARRCAEVPGPKRYGKGKKSSLASSGRGTSIGRGAGFG